MGARRKIVEIDSPALTGEVNEEFEAVDILAGLTIPPGYAAMLGSNCAYAGIEYQANANGVVIVPEAATNDLTYHGFRRL
jgi:hypothetical protein